jgi:hypothetical protein
MADDVLIIDTTEDFVPDEAGKFVKHMRIRFKVGNDGPFTRHFPADTFSASAARLAIDDFARELRALKA